MQTHSPTARADGSLGDYSSTNESVSLQISKQGVTSVFLSYLCARISAHVGFPSVSKARMDLSADAVYRAGYSNTINTRFIPHTSIHSIPASVAHRTLSIRRKEQRPNSFLVVLDLQNLCIGLLRVLVTASNRCHHTHHNVSSSYSKDIEPTQLRISSYTCTMPSIHPTATISANGWKSMSNTWLSQ